MKNINKILCVLGIGCAVVLVTQSAPTPRISNVTQPSSGSSSSSSGGGIFFTNTDLLSYTNQYPVYIIAPFVVGDGTGEDFKVNMDGDIAKLHGVTYLTWPTTLGVAGSVMVERDGLGHIDWTNNLTINTGVITNLTVVSNIVINENITVKGGATLNYFSVTNWLDVTNPVTSWDMFFTNGLMTTTHSNNTTDTASTGFALTNKVVATVGSQKYSPYIIFGGNGWKTTATAGSQPVNARIGIVPAQGATSPTVSFRIETSTNNSSYKRVADFDSENGQTNQNLYLALGASGVAPMVLAAPGGTSMGFLSSGANQLRLNGSTSVTLATAHTDRWSFTSSEMQALSADYDIGTAGTAFRAFFHKNYTSKSADTTCTDASMISTALSSSVTTTRKYSIHMVLFFTNTVAADGLKIDFDGGACTATRFRMHTVIYHDSGIAVQQYQNVFATDVVAATLTGSGTAVCNGFLEVNGSGTFIPRFSENTDGGGTLTCLIGSFEVMQTLLSSP